MSDPTIQMFCCYYNQNGSFMSKVISEHFNSNYYNTLCLISSILGVVGALYQIWPKEYNLHSQLYCGSRLRVIIKHLSIGDLLASLGVFVRSTFWFSTKSILPRFGDYSSMLVCVFTSVWIQYFYMSTWLWTLCYAIDIYLIFQKKTVNVLRYHLITWSLPAIFTVLGVSLLYSPNSNCNAINTLKSAITHILPNYLLTYIPLTMIILTNPILYFLSIKKLKQIIIHRYGQLTNRERYFIDNVRIRFTFINVIFSVCWLPNMVNGVVLWMFWSKLSPKVIVNLWYICAFVNPLQALFNCLVYRRKINSTEKLLVPYQKRNNLSESRDINEFSPIVTRNVDIPTYTTF